METSKKNNMFYIKDNILIGQEIFNLDKIFCINIGELILQSFESHPRFIGQVDAETGETNTFQDMRVKSLKCAVWMQKVGVQPNNVIMICTNNQLDAYVPFLAALYIGAVVSPLDLYFVEDNFNYFLEQVKPTMLFIDEKFYTIANDTTKHLKLFKNIPLPFIVVFPDKNEDLLNTNRDLMTLEKIIYDIDYNYACRMKYFSCAKVMDMKSIAMILFTSGTTASPALVKIPHLAFMAPSDQQAPKMLKNDIALLFESLCFINGIFITIQAILLQVKIIRVKQFDAEVACTLIEKFKVTWAFLETSMCCHLINNKSYDRKKYDVSSLRTLVFTGSTLYSQKVHKELKAWLPMTSILQAYSLTETGIIAYQRETGIIGSSGHVSANVQLKIISLDFPDKLLGPKMSGEICCISPYMMSFQELYDFYNSNKLLISLWFKTGDKGYYDEYGNIYIVERLKYLLEFKNQSHQFSSTILEAILCNHSGVFEAVVIYVPCSNNDNAIAFVTKISGIKVTEEELKQFVKERSNNELRNVIFIPYLPRFSNGKINRKLIHKMAIDIFYESDIISDTVKREL